MIYENIWRIYSLILLLYENIKFAWYILKHKENLPELYREICYYEMLGVAVVAASDIISVLLIKRKRVKILFVQAPYERGVFNNQDELRRGSF